MKTRLLHTLLFSYIFNIVRLVKPLLGAFEREKYLCRNSCIINDNIFRMGYDKFYKASFQQEKIDHK